MRTGIIKSSLAVFLLFIYTITAAQNDSSRYLTAAQLTQLVKQFHPVARQASLLPQMAKAELTMARGGFDPVLQYSGGQKTFDGTRYYMYDNKSLAIPVWFGAEITAGTEYLGGSRTNAEETKGESSYLGISIPLAKNLLMDKRRAALKTAKIMVQSSEAERRELLNNLLLEALNTYWEWVAAWRLLTIATDAVMVNEQRLNLVRIAFRQGDRPALDTTETLAQLQSFRLLQLQARNSFIQNGIELSAYLWQADGQPVNLPEDVLPGPEEQQLTFGNRSWPDLQQLQETARQNHPLVQQYQFKLETLAVEKKLKFQELLPSVTLRYNQLGKGYDIIKAAQAPLFENNYRYGVSIGIPLRLSEGRGAYRLAGLKIAEAKLAQQQLWQKTSQKIRAAYTEMTALQQQSEVQERAVQQYRQLLRGEEIRFANGESSLFLVNARENKTLEAGQKLVELRKKLFQYYNKLLWAAGQLWQP